MNTRNKNQIKNTNLKLVDLYHFLFCYYDFIDEVIISGSLCHNYFYFVFVRVSIPKSFFVLIINPWKLLLNLLSLKIRRDTLINVFFFFQKQICNTSSEVIAIKIWWIFRFYNKFTKNVYFKKGQWNKVERFQKFPRGSR